MLKTAEHERILSSRTLIRLGILSLALSGLTYYSFLPAQSACIVELAANTSDFRYVCENERSTADSIQLNNTSTNLPSVCFSPLVRCIRETGSTSAYQPAETDWSITSGQCQSPCNTTASGQEVIYYETAACSASIPFGTQVYIKNEKAPGFTGPYVCSDRGDEQLAAQHGFKNPWVDIAIPPHENPGLFTDKNIDLVFVYKNEKDTILIPKEIASTVVAPPGINRASDESELTTKNQNGDTFTYKEYRVLPEGHFVMEDGEMKTKVELP